MNYIKSILFLLNNVPESFFELGKNILLLELVS